MEKLKAGRRDLPVPNNSRHGGRSYQKHLFETGIVLVLVIALARGFYELRVLEWFAPYVAVSVAILLVYGALIHASFRGESVDYFDRSLADWKRSFQWFFLTFVLVIPLFFIANHFWQGFIFQRAFIPDGIPDLGSLLIYQLFLIAIPEEIFFRGWLQSRLNSIFPRRWPVLGVSVGWAWLLTAFLFATAHSLILYQWWHFAIFFPALLFGWLRERTGGITAPALFHWSSNIAVNWIAVSYL